MTGTALPLISTTAMLKVKKVKVLECIRQGQIGGGESHLLSLIENLDRDNFDPVVLSFTEGPMIDKLKLMNVSTYVIGTETPFDVRVWQRVKDLLIEEKIQLIHCHGTRATSNLFRAAKSLNIPLIYTIHGWSFHDDQNPLVRKIRILSERFLTQRANINIAVSESNMLSGKKRIPSLKATIINNGIDQNKFNPSNHYSNIRNEIGISEKTVLIISIARFTAHKQPLKLITAFADAVKINSSMELLMVGQGDQEAQATELVRSLAIESKVHFLPFRQDVPDLLASADVFVLPSLWEGLPIGLLEAMSMGKAIIATNVDGTSEIIDHLNNGLLIEVNKVSDDLPKALLKLAEDRNLRLKLGMEAIETVKNRFNATQMTRSIEEIYSGLTK